MRPTSLKFSRSPLALLAALVCASTPFLAYAGDGATATYEFRQTVPTLVVSDGAAPVGALSLSTGAINFGNVATHTSETRQVLVSNDGTGVVGFTADPVVTGAAFAAGLTSCASALGVNASCLTEATFSPTTVGDFSGALTFATDLAGSPHAVSLAGTAFNPVSLTPATLPTAKLNRAYTPYNFASLLAVSNETSPTLADVSWSATGAPPAGMSFNTGTATLSGTPTALTAPEGTSFTVLATYKSNQGQQAFTIKVGEAVLEAVQVSAGGSHTCAVTAAGGVKCWGLDSSGQLGNDAALADKPTPVDVYGLTSGVASVSAGSLHTCAVTTAGGVKCWGYGVQGQLGINSRESKATPTDVLGMASGVSSLAAGAYHNCAVTTAGGLKCWGADGNGQLGNDDVQLEKFTPVDVYGLTSGVVSVAAGDTHTCAVTAAGGVKCWGWDNYGQLGRGMGWGSAPQPVDVQGLASGVSRVSAGYHHTCALTAAGGVKCWGSDDNGQLGNDAALADKPAPVEVSGLTSGVVSVSAGYLHTCAVTAAGALKCWGEDAQGQLGNDTALTDKPTPVGVSGLTSGVASVSAGGYHTCVVTTASALKCWGYDYAGQLGNDAAPASAPTPVNVAE